jgi:uncharacterized protein (TIGR00255 family)
MIVSMTGFGDASAQRDDTHYAVEVRSLNNRYFKAVIKLPDALAGLEPEIETMLRDKLGRGSITYILKTRTDSADAAVPINTAALQAYIRQLQAIGLGEGKIDLGALLALPGVCQEGADDSESIERHGPIIRQLTVQAVEKLLAMRQREGKALHEDLGKHLSIIENSVAEVEKRAPSVVNEYHRRLTSRVNELMGKAELKVNEGDLLKEIAVFAERSDVSEEIQRLRHHCKQFRDSCLKGEHAGRKLDFITQEMLREANTIASKANDAEIAGLIVEVKGAIDRLKEQVQNVE